MSPNNPRDALVTEALRLHGRYLREVVERFSICPWAKSARLEGRTRTHVVTEAECGPVELRPLVDAWSADPVIDVAFVIAPLFEGVADEFSAWAASIGELDGNAFFCAPFFPRAPSSASTVHFLRQSPDPTVQLVRRTTLEAARAQDPPHYADIFDVDLRDLQAEHPQRTVAAAVLAHNDRTIKHEGKAKLQSILDDIRNDRNQTYARIKGVRPPFSKG